MVGLVTCSRALCGEQVLPPVDRESATEEMQRAICNKRRKTSPRRTPKAPKGALGAAEGADYRVECQFRTLVGELEEPGGARGGTVRGARRGVLCGAVAAGGAAVGGAGAGAAGGGRGGGGGGGCAADDREGGKKT